MDAKYQNLLPLVSKYKEEMAAVQIRRTLWNKQTKALIQKSFKEFIDAFSLPCYIDIEDGLLHQEAIFLAFDDEETGIVLKSKNQMMIQSGGGLVYHQNANGKIQCMFILPYIEGIKGEKGVTRDIGAFKPEDIDESLILSHIHKFFKEILEWECFLREPIGFKRNS
ncbi:unnamed protein product [marine sediment metagenome]|uniref:Uncharacterized protein n=1 Tax=marine sediment metagenome TaxID=412755 RepID=X0ZMQ2_9ZZZZ